MQIYPIPNGAQGVGAPIPSRKVWARLLQATSNSRGEALARTGEFDQSIRAKQVWGFPYQQREGRRRNRPESGWTPAPLDARPAPAERALGEATTARGEPLRRLGGSLGFGGRRGALSGGVRQDRRAGELRGGMGRTRRPVASPRVPAPARREKGSS